MLTSVRVATLAGCSVARSARVCVRAGGLPHAWFAFDDADCARKVCVADPLQPWEVWDCASARELLDLFGRTPDPRYDAPGGWRARLALRERLTATEMQSDAS
jgi:hypothetical protein